MTSTGDIAAKLVNALNASIPDLDTSPGTPTRKILDAVSEVVAEAYSDAHLISYQYDIDSKVGGDLDDFCFVPGTLVVTRDGLKPIEEIRPDEEVISHTGKTRRVLAMSSRQVDESIVRMRPLGQPAVSMTANHPVFATKRDWLVRAGRGERSFRLRGTGSRAVWRADDVRREWLPAGELDPGDVVWGPAPEPTKRSQLNKNLQRLYGWFLAEGSTTECGRIVFSLHENETSYHEAIEELIKSEWGFARVSHSKPNPGERQLTVFSKKFARKLRDLLGHGCADKHIPWDVFWSGSDLTDLLAAVWQGDGHVSDKDVVADFVTTSPALAYQVRALLLRKKIFTRLDVTERPGRRTAYRLTARGEDALRIAQITKEATPALTRGAYASSGVVLDGWLGQAIAEHELVGYRGPVHNLEVDVDNSYTLFGGMAAHNCALFGITRLPAARASGVVTFTRPADAYTSGSALVIPPGTQVVALTNPPVTAQTTVSQVLNPGQLTADIPVQAVTAGAAGNVAAGMLINFGTGLTGVSSVINASPMTGGSNQESDTDLRTRFKATVFRSLAGTQSMYQAIALATPQDPTTPGVNAVSQVNVIGSSKRYREQIQVVSGTATSTVQNAAYIFPDNMYCGPDIDAGNFLTSGTDFTFTPTNPTTGANASAVITSSSTNMPDGLYDLDFEYVPQASRNDPGNTRFAQGGINNRVDIWVNGQIGTTATQSVVFSNSRVFNTTQNSPYQASQFATSNPASPTPPVGYYFIPLAFGPILSLPTTIVIAGTTYTQGTDYWAVWRNDAFGRSPRSLQGILWQTTRVPANGAAFSVTYNYNTVARNAQENVDQWRLVGTDARVHCGIPMPVRFYLAIVYDRQYDSSSVNTNISTALASLCAGVGFNNQLQVSDVIQAVHNVPGVDNVRFQTSGDNASNYAMALMSAWATVPTQISLYANNGRVVDASFADNQYPVFYDVVISKRAKNTFRTGA